MEGLEMSLNNEVSAEQQPWSVMQQHPYAYMAGQHMTYVPNNPSYAQPMWGPQVVQFMPSPHGPFYGGVMPGFPTVSAVQGVSPEGSTEVDNSGSHAANQDLATANDLHALSNPRCANLDVIRRPHEHVATTCVRCYLAFEHRNEIYWCNRLFE